MPPLRYVAGRRWQEGDSRKIKKRRSVGSGPVLAKHPPAPTFLWPHPGGCGGNRVVTPGTLSSGGNSGRTARAANRRRRSSGLRRELRAAGSVGSLAAVPRPSGLPRGRGGRRPGDPPEEGFRISGGSRHPSTSRAWLRSIAIHACVDRVRSARLRRAGTAMRSWRSRPGNILPSGRPPPRKNRRRS